jgi:hypothetical protein
VPSSSGAEDDDQYREARAYNNTIYLMVGMPYLLCAVLGFRIWRGLKQKALAEARAALPEDGRGEEPCPPPSTADTSWPKP